MTKERTRTIAYIRVSTDKQAETGFSMDAQREKLAAYAIACDLEIIAFEVDSASASSLDRPALKRALEALDTFRAEAILVVKLDRLTRSVTDLCRLVDTYFRDGERSLLSVSEHIDTRSAAGRMILKILTTIGEWEREAIGERTAAVMRHMKEQGLFTGGWPPFGWAIGDDGMLVKVPEEQAMILHARALHDAGYSLRAISGALGPSRNGKPFAAAQIARML